MFKQILVALDGSDYSQGAVPAAIEIAKRFGSTVFVLHVSEHDRGRAVAYSIESPAEAMRLVGDAVRTINAAGVSAEGTVHDAAAGHVAKDVVTTASTLNADLIVMGSRGLSDVQGVLLGSVTHKVMQLAQVAVLVVRGPVPVEEKVRQPAFQPALATA